MILSMTGYGKGVIQKNEIIAEVEVKSLNNRFQELNVKLPRSLASKELELREVLKNKISRGKISVNVFLKREGLDNSRNLFIDKAALAETIKLLNEINNESGLNAQINFEHLLTFQYLFFSDSTGDENLEFNLVLEALNKAIENLNQMREHEGRELVKDLKFRIGKIENILAKIEEISRTQVVEYFGKIQERAKQMMADLGEYDDRLKLELALLAEKYDITEEIVRLKSHIKLFNDTIDNSVEVGRKLNFLIQELNRESNTINSKSITSEISHLGLEIKEEIEKIREQIQNLE